MVTFAYSFFLISDNISNIVIKKCLEKIEK